MNTFKILRISLIALCFFGISFSQTHPTPHDLSTGNWSLSGWKSDVPAESYPGNGATGLNNTTGVVAGIGNGNMMFWRQSAFGNLVGPQDPNGDYVGDYNVSNISRFMGRGQDGISILITGSTTQGRPNSAILGLNATGRENIIVQWTGGTQTLGGGTPPHVQNIRLQYKIGNTSTTAWTDVPGAQEYTSAGKAAGHRESFNATLPSVCDDEPQVYLRWVYYLFSAGTGTRPELIIDDITVSSTAIPVVCTLPTTQATNFTSSAISPDTATIGWTRGNGNSVLVVARANGPVNASPTNGQNYNANASFNSGSQIGTGNFVVYKGTGSSVDISNLSPGTYYHFAIYEFFTTDNCYTEIPLIGEIETPPPLSNTIFEPGDFAVLGLNSNIQTCGYVQPSGNDPYTPGADEVSFMNFKAILSGDTFFITDNGYERRTSSGPNTWGNTEGVYKLVRTGGTIIAGTVITIRLRNEDPFVEFISPDTGWSFNKENGFTGGMQNVVMNANGDQLFFMQGGSWNAGTTNQHNAVYTPGTLLFVINTNNSWESGGESTKKSGLPPDLQCFNIMPNAATDFLEYTGPTSITDKYDWINRISNPANWTNRGSCAGYTGMHVGQTYLISTSSNLVKGKWNGAKDNNWFNCGNWDTLVVPDQTTNVLIPVIPGDKPAKIEHNAPFANRYGNIAKTRNLTISGEKVVLEGSANHKLEVHGNLLINGNGELDMSDGNNTTPDGQLYLYGNWTNNLTESDFKEGNSTVHFMGNIPQNVVCGITNDSHIERFNHVVLNNNLTTANFEGELIVEGNLTVSPGKTFTALSGATGQPGHSVRVDDVLTTSGATVTFSNNSSLIQKSSATTNSNVGNIIYNRVSSLDVTPNVDYVYWGAPVEGQFTPASGHVYRWDNGAGTFGNWVLARNAPMVAGQGFIMRGIASRNFIGRPHNGTYSQTVSRRALFPDTRDNWNLVANPYPSAINALKFLQDFQNTRIEGMVALWTHGSGTSASNPPVYYNNQFLYNYSPDDYVYYNALGSTSGSGITFDGNIAAGQAFFVRYDDGAAAESGDIFFKNDMRRDSNGKAYDNTQMFNVVEMHRIWLDVVNSDMTASRTLLGYATDATDEKDRLYDAHTTASSSKLKIYSMIDAERMIIQAKGLPFQVNDTFNLGLSIPSAGEYHISLYDVDGLFTTQNIYLEDTQLDVIHDLKSSPYPFTVDAVGENLGRFVLRFTNETLSTPSFEVENNVYVLTNDKLQVLSMRENIKSINVYDMLGRSIYTNDVVNSKSFDIPVFSYKSPLIIKMTLEHGEIVKRKTIY